MTFHEGRKISFVKLRVQNIVDIYFTGVITRVLMGKQIVYNLVFNGHSLEISQNGGRLECFQILICKPTGK